MDVAATRQQTVNTYDMSCWGKNPKYYFLLFSKSVQCKNTSKGMRTQNIQFKENEKKSRDGHKISCFNANP